MSGKTIATIYFYLISVGAIILMVIGIFHSVTFLINSTQYEKYPLRYERVPSCDFATDGQYVGGPFAPPVKVIPSSELGVTGITPATPSAGEIQRAKENCLKNEEADRIQHRVDDMKNAITFTLVGAVLFLIHFPQARKHSKS
jgi:hypothetical protein